MSENNRTINKLKKGDKRAFEKLFYVYYPRLIKYAKSFIPDHDTAEDLVQDVFIKVWNKRNVLDEEKQFSSFIYSMVRNSCLNKLKRKVVEDKYLMHQAKFESEELYHLSFEIDGDFVSLEDKLNYELDQIILKMPERCQTAFRLKWFKGKKIKEIAEIMKISTTMVDKHLAKGLQIAKENLHPEMFLFLIINLRS